MLIVQLKKDGYFVQEIIGTRPMLTLWGSKPDPRTMLEAYP
jgi:hypothetical protein